MLYYFLLSFYLLSGDIKAFLNHYGINSPIDITLLSAIFLIIYGLYNIKIIWNTSLSNHFTNALFTLLIFYLWLFASLIYSASSNYGTEKAFLFLTNIFTFVIIRAKPNFDLRMFIKILSLNIIILSALFLPILFSFTVQGSEDNLGIQQFYLTGSTTIGLLLVVIVTTNEIFFSKFLKSSIVICFILLLVILGGRGPALFSFGLLIIYMIIQIRKKGSNNFIKAIRRSRFFLILSVIVCILIYLKFGSEFNLLFERSLGRLQGLQSGTDESTLGRLNFFEKSFSFIFQNNMSFFFGYGIGSYGIVTNGIDGRAYPHNLFLEIWFEMGIIGLTIFIFFLWQAFRAFSSKKVTLSIMVLLYFILNVSKSSSLIDLRIMFAFIAIAFLQRSNNVLPIVRTKMLGFN